MGRNVVIFGATGRTGRHLVDQALAGSHDVVAFARRPEVVPVGHPRLRLVGGDLTRTDDIRPALQGREVALIAVGATGIGRRQVSAVTAARILEVGFSS